MKKLIVLFVCILISVTLNAQMDVVKLKSGSEIRGFIIEKSEQQVKIKTKGGSIWVFKTKEVESIERYKPQLKKKGHYMSTQMSLLAGSRTSGSFLVVNGYYFNPKLSFGLGMGFEGFYGDMYTPLFIEGNYSLLKKSATPFVSLAAGYDMPLQFKSGHKGGFLGMANIGFKREIGQHFGIITSVGYRFSRLVRKNTWGWEQQQSSIIITEINRLDFRFGFIFR